MDYGPPGFSVHGISQARIPEWVAISFSRGSSQPGIKPGSSALQTDPLLTEPPRKPGVKNGSVFIPIPKKGNAKECSNYHTIALISHASKVMLKILQARLQQYMNQELPDVQGGFRKGRGTRDQIANICRIIEKAREFQKNTSASLTMLKPLTVWITTNCGKFLKRWKYQTSWPAFWETCMQVKKQQLELDMEQWTGSKIGKGVRQGCILSPCLFNLYAEYIMRNGGWSTSWNQDFKEKYQ